jgi:hypothetical protein
MSAAAGDICENGTSTRFESTLAFPVDMHQLRRQFRLRRRFQHQLRSRFRLESRQEISVSPPLHADAAPAQLLRRKSFRRRLPLIPLDQREHPAARPARRDALQPPRRRLAELRREIGDHQEVIFLGHAARLLVVLGDRRVLVAQVHLDHFFDVLVQLGRAALRSGSAASRCAG